MFPTPASGEHIPPARKAAKPKIADAIPEFCLTGSIANVVEVGRIIPTKNSVSSIEISIATIPASNTRVVPVSIVAAKNNDTPVLIAFSAVLNFNEHRLPSMIPNALNAKQIL